MNKQLKLFNYNLDSSKVDKLNGINKLIYIHISNMITNQNYTLKEAISYTVNFYSCKMQRYRIKQNILNVFNDEKKDIEVYVYLIFDGNYYKIGKSKDPEKRLKSIKTGNANAVLICYANERIINEKQLHTIYFNYRVNGEWFDLNQKQIDNIILLMKDKKDENLINQTVKMQTTRQKRIKNKAKFIMPYGKYKGVNIEDIEDINYLQYMKSELYNRLANNDRKKSVMYNSIDLRLKEIKSSII